MSLYYLKESELSKASLIMAEAFQEDPLYIHLEPNADLRAKLLPIFFKHYLSLMQPYSHLVADSSHLNAVALWYDDTKLSSAFLWYLRSGKAIINGISMCRYISPTDYIYKLKQLLKMGSGWISTYQKEEEWASYIHLDMLVTPNSSRGKGHAHRLMETCINTFLPQHPVSTIETHNPKNVAYYEKYGYRVIKEIQLENSSLIQYCMMNKQYFNINQ